MNPILLLEFTVAVLVLAILFTQIIIPIWRGLPIFPIFRKKRTQVDSELSQAREGLDQAKIRHETRSVRTETKKTNQK